MSADWHAAATSFQGLPSDESMFEPAGFRVESIDFPQRRDEAPASAGLYRGHYMTCDQGSISGNIRPLTATVAFHSV